MHPTILLTTLNAKYIHLNLAIRILYDLNHHKGNIDWKEFTIKSDFDEVAQKCAKYNIVCFSCYIWNITQTLEVCKRIKQISPETKILLGGPEISYEYDEIIANNFIDYIIVGEGEIPFSEFMDNFPSIENVPNLVYKKGDKIIFNKQNVTFDIKELENRNPYQYDDPSTLTHRVCYIETSRGCPYKCEFCLASLDNKMRYLPMDTIKANLLYLMEHGKTIKFLDRTFNIKRDFTIELFQFILDHHKPGNVFQFEITADIVHPDIINFINEKVPPGLFRFEIGIQTVNQESNREVSRKQNFEKTSNVINQLKDRIEMHLDLIVGLPLEYIDDLKFSFEETFKLYPPELQLGFLKFLKGTPVRQKYENYGYQFDPLPPYQIIKSKFLSKDELQNITYLEHALEIYWNKPRAINTLKYIATHYSIFDYLMQLGTYFVKRNHAYKFTIIDIYETFIEFEKQHTNDPIILELLAIDYYSSQKSKPKDLFSLDLNINEVELIKNNFQLNSNNKLVIIPLRFNYNTWNTSNSIINKKDYYILEYPGNELPIIHEFENVLI